MTTSDYLTQLQQDKEDLVDNLTEKGITGLTGDETFTELVPEVLNIPSGSGPEDLFITGDKAGLINDNNTESFSAIIGSIKEFPNLSFRFDNSAYRNTLPKMFEGAFNMTKCNMSNFSNIKSTSMYNMFSYCYNLENIIWFDDDGINYNTIRNISNIFKSCRKLNQNDIQYFINKLSYIENCIYLCCECYKLTNLSFPQNFSKYNSSSANDWSYAFYKCINLEEINMINSGDGYKNLNGMFRECTKLETINMSGCDLSNVNSLNSSGLLNMFIGCTNLTNLNLGTGLGSGYNCTAFTYNVQYGNLDLSMTNKLTKESVINVFNGLGTTNATNNNNRPSIKLHSDVYNQLSSEEILIATDKNWNVISV